MAIVDLFHPQGHRVNSGISNELCFLSNITVDNTITVAQNMGRKTLMTKIDIKSVLLPVHPTNCHLFVMRWKQQLYIDACQSSFGFPPTLKLFNMLADLFFWILEQQGVSPIMHYLDNYLTLALLDATTCHWNLDVI